MPGRVRSSARWTWLAALAVLLQSLAAPIHALAAHVDRGAEASCATDCRDHAGDAEPDSRHPHGRGDGCPECLVLAAKLTPPLPPTPVSGPAPTPEAVAAAVTALPAPPAAAIHARGPPSRPDSRPSS